MSNPDITVLMTVYNGGEFLRAAIESILAQTFTSFEFLIIDDCSKDQSVHLIQSYRDDRIRCIQNEVNLGQTRSLNKGLSIARGRMIARLDADDVAFPQWLEKNYAMLTADPQLAVVSCKAVVIDQDNTVQRILNTPLTYDEMILRSILQSPINHVGSLYRSDVINSLGGYDPSFKIAADYELWSNLIRKGIRIASHPEPLVAIRFHEGSISIQERGRTDIEEISRVIRKNIHELAAIDLTHEEILSLWKLCYASRDIDHHELHVCILRLNEIYDEVQRRLNLQPEMIEKYFKQYRYLLYSKRVFAYMNEGNASALRQLINQYRTNVGWNHLFSLFWLSSWFGKNMLQMVPSFFKAWLKLKTRRAIKQNKKPELLSIK